MNTPQEEYWYKGIQSTLPTTEITKEDIEKRKMAIIGFPEFISTDSYIYRIAELEAEVLKLRAQMK